VNAAGNAQRKAVQFVPDGKNLLMENRPVHTRVAWFMGSWLPFLSGFLKRFWREDAAARMMLQGDVNFFFSVRRSVKSGH
jgi:hypothetical protein